MSAAAETFRGPAYRFKASQSASGLRLTGVAFRRNGLAQSSGGLTLIPPGSWENVPGQVYMLREHDSGRLIGSWQVSEEALGLVVRGDVVPTTEGRDAALLVREGLLSGLSVGYNWSASPEVVSGREALARYGPSMPTDAAALLAVNQDQAVRVARPKSCSLLECSLVTWPAEDGSRIRDQQRADAPDDLAMLAELEVVEAVVRGDL